VAVRPTAAVNLLAIIAQVCFARISFFQGFFDKYLMQEAPNLLVDSLEKGYAGPPPPSPPASVDRTHEDSSKNAATPSRILISGTGEEILSLERKPPPSPRRHASTIIAGTSALIHGSSVPKSPHNFLHPSLNTSRRERHARRNTTGSSPSPFHHVKHGSQPFVFEDTDIDNELATDIRLHAAQIRKERQERQSRAKVEAALTKAGERTPLVGNVIGEGHVNYVLMYNMLTGIRIAVRAKREFSLSIILISRRCPDVKQKLNAL
jgi:1-phosphatidylinositol-4-phosphate 5-kinase